MGRALPGEIGKEGESLGPGGPSGGVCGELVVRDPGGGRVPEPSQRAGCGQHHAHRMPSAGDGMTERVQASPGIGREPVQGREHDAGGAEHDRQRPGTVHTDPERPRGLVAAAGGDRDLLACHAGHGRALEHLRKPAGVELQRAQHLVAPAPGSDVEEQRSRRIRDVRGVLA